MQQVFVFKRGAILLAVLALIIVGMFAPTMSTAQAQTISDNEAVLAVGQGTQSDGIWDLAATLQGYGIRNCAYGDPVCWSYTHFTGMNLNRTGANSVWVTANHFGRINTTGQYWRGQWRARAFKGSSGQLLIDASTKFRVSYPTNIF